EVVVPRDHDPARGDPMAGLVECLDEGTFLRWRGVFRLRGTAIVRQAIEQTRYHRLHVLLRVVRAPPWNRIHRLRNDPDNNKSPKDATVNRYFEKLRRIRDTANLRGNR